MLESSFFAKCGLWAPFEHPLISPISVFVETHFLPPVKMAAGVKGAKTPTFLFVNRYSCVIPHFVRFNEPKH